MKYRILNQGKLMDAFQSKQKCDNNPFLTFIILSCRVTIIIFTSSLSLKIARRNTIIFEMEQTQNVSQSITFINLVIIECIMKQH